MLCFAALYALVMMHEVPHSKPCDSRLHLAILGQIILCIHSAMTDSWLFFRPVACGIFFDNLHEDNFDIIWNNFYFRICANNSQKMILFVFAFGAKSMPHVCNHCMREFKKKSYRDRHERTHTGENPYPCQHCEQSFTTSETSPLMNAPTREKNRIPASIASNRLPHRETSPFMKGATWRRWPLRLLAASFQPPWSKVRHTSLGPAYPSSSCTQLPCPPPHPTPSSVY